MKINTQNFQDLLRYRNPKLNMESTIDTRNIVGMQQKEKEDLRERETEIIVKNTFSDKQEHPYLVYTVKDNIANVLETYDQACNNVSMSLGTITAIQSYSKINNNTFA